LIFLLHLCIIKNGKMKKIVEILKKETVSLKKQYVEMTEKWAVKEFNRMKSVKESDIINERGFKNRSGKMEHTKASYAYYNNIRRSVDKGSAVFVKESIQNAKEHYEDSILKLADRISKKGLEVDKIKVKTSHIGQNIDTLLTDGKKKVNAFTIIASGEIQKPHYRYLIK